MKSKVRGCQVEHRHIVETFAIDSVCWDTGHFEGADSVAGLEGAGDVLRLSNGRFGDAAGSAEIWFSVGGGCGMQVEI